MSAPFHHRPTFLRLEAQLYAILALVFLLNFLHYLHFLVKGIDKHKRKTRCTLADNVQLPGNKMQKNYQCF